MLTLRHAFVSLLAAVAGIAPASSVLAQAGSIAPLDTAAILAHARPEIDAANAAWVPGLQSHEADPIVAAYSDSAVFVTNDGKLISGRAAIRDLYVSRFPNLPKVVGGAVRQTGLTVVKPDRIYEWGEAWLDLAPASPGAAPSRHGGTYLTVWQRESDGHWRITHNISMN